MAKKVGSPQISSRCQGSADPTRPARGPFPPPGPHGGPGLRQGSPGPTRRPPGRTVPATNPDGPAGALGTAKRRGDVARLTVTPSEVTAPVQPEALAVAVRGTDGEPVARLEVGSAGSATPRQGLSLVHFLALPTALGRRRRGRTHFLSLRGAETRSSVGAVSGRAGSRGGHSAGRESGQRLEVAAAELAAAAQRAVR